MVIEIGERSITRATHDWDDVAFDIFGTVDVDGDGVPELLVTSKEGLTIVRRDRTTMSLNDSHPLDVEWRSNDEGRELDLFTLNAIDGGVRIDELSCTLAVAQRCELSSRHEVDSRADALVVGDFDEDGRDDVVLGGSQQLALVRGVADERRWGSPEEIGLVQGPSSEVSNAAMLAADLDSDGHLDVAALDEMVGVVGLFGAGDGSFIQSDLADGELFDAHRLHAIDLGGDGRIELVVVGWSNTWILEKQGRRSFARSDELDAALGGTAPPALVGNFDEAPGLELLLVETAVDVAHVASYPDAASAWVVREISRQPDDPTNYIPFATAWDVDDDGIDEVVGLLGAPIYCE